MAIDLTQPGAVQQAMAPIRAMITALEPGGAAADPALRAAALVTRDEVVLELSKPGTGRVYTTTFYVDGQGRLRVGPLRGKPHQASAPGEPPAVDSGELRASIEMEIRDGVAYVGSTLERAQWLENGYVTAWGTIVEPRPFMRTVAERLPELLPEIVGTELAGRISIVLRSAP